MSYGRFVEARRGWTAEYNLVNREQYESMELDSKVHLIQDLTSIGMMHVSEILQQEVAELAGARYAEVCQNSRDGHPG